jgi:hypothetical protein
MADRNQVLRDHAEILIDLLYGRPIEDDEDDDLSFTEPFVEKLAAYPNNLTLSWSYEERLEALTDIILTDLDPDDFYKPTWLWNLVRPRPFRLVKKLQQMFPRRDGMHHSTLYDMNEPEDEDEGHILNQPLEMVEGVAQTQSLDQGDSNGAFNLTSELIDCIGEKHMETFRLLVKHGSPQAAARAIGIEDGTFRQRLFRARQAAAKCNGLDVLE